ncbi:hypothetical protein NDU88_004917 [Pleurodeles waltl]|uniref:Uncharacterized protein n=1 Tax=Pleurodeles waltl TaxID=8319 RepID=A0AAV7VK24_PLEWA|nr:hypothetical protein NDU88_004917 [Pleurodeles waltl]
MAPAKSDGTGLRGPDRFSETLEQDEADKGSGVGFCCCIGGSIEHALSSATGGGSRTVLQFMKASLALYGGKKSK